LRFVTGLVGQRMTDNSAFIGWFKSQVQKTIKDRIASLIVKQNWPIMKVTSGAYTEEIEEHTVGAVRRHIESYGVEIMRFGDFTISMDAKDRDRLDKLVERAAYINMTGGLQGYQQFAQAEMMMGASEGMRKGGGGAAGNAMAGAGIGMGFGMAGQMMGMMNQPQQPAAPQRPVNTPVQSTMGSTVTCGACNAQVAPGKFCAECGKPLATEPQKRFCSNCGAAMAGKFCGECGTPAPA
jgi:membrane protease subunit (stomatin/prohibitin family)